MDRTIAIVLGGGRGTRLYPLTRHRSKPAVPFGGMYRLIDIPISNCLNSDINRIFVITQFNSASLNRHTSMTYNFDSFRDGFVSILAAEQTLEHSDWLQGTADAVRKNLRHIRPSNAEDVLILSGDHIYSMDYRPMMALHRRVRADITIATIPVILSDAKRFGIMQVGDDGRILEFCEKPDSEEKIHGWELPPSMFAGTDQLIEQPVVMASMGIYILNHQSMEMLLDSNSGSDFGRHIIPDAIKSHRVFAFPFHGYWEDIGTISAYYHANLALTDLNPQFDLYNPAFRLFTRPRFLPGSSLNEVEASQALICAGCRIEKSKIRHSILGTRTIVRSNAIIEDSIIVGADYFESEEALAQNRESHAPDVGIGGDTTIRRTIVDKNARIGYGVTIDPPAGHPDMDSDGYIIRDGIVIIEKDAVIPDGMRIPE
ncbi:glucose-1-phosphate adenylyltransferase [bacterium]|nr:glucose-1-phosphate adenylyltransferase [bacterium]MBU1637598.1 glucose-1-phosphate adenylyltransferase [bacterium]MBU1919473.1 glucose-1-phosphate adenylyltransferase [bacterium]RQV97887.1 MAG: glucose-1-phosphate adenylyltransferase [bacterium]